MNNALELAAARAIQVDREILRDLNFLRINVQSEATREEVEQLLDLFILRAANRTTVAHGELWQTLHPEWTGDIPPLLPLSLYSPDAPSSAHLGVVRTSITDCRSDEGITVGLIDALISILRVLAQRDLTPLVVCEALLDLAGDSDLQQVLDGAAQVCLA